MSIVTFPSSVNPSGKFLNLRVVSGSPEYCRLLLSRLSRSISLFIMHNHTIHLQFSPAEDRRYNSSALGTVLFISGKEYSSGKLI